MVLFIIMIYNTDHVQQSFGSTGMVESVSTLWKLHTELKYDQY